MCRKLFLLTSFVLVLGLVGSASAFQVVDDFESGNLNIWEITEGQAAVAIGPDPTTPGNNCLVFSPGDITMRTPWGLPEGNAEKLSYRLMYDRQVDGTVTLIFGASDPADTAWGNYYAIARMNSYGDPANIPDMDVRDGGAYTDVVQADLEPLRWYDVMLDIDTASKKYDVYIDGVLVFQGAAFRSGYSPANLEYIILRTTTWDNNFANGTVYVDDIVLGEPIEPAGANIIWVSKTQDADADGIQDDQGFIDLLTAEGHTVDVRLDYWGQLDLEPAKVDELNAADLVIVSRSTSSGDHDEGDEPALWNSVTAPMIQMSTYLVRTNRWLWMNTNDVNQVDAILMATDASHPVFDGVELIDGTMVIAYDNTVSGGLTTFPATIDVGNGTLIAQTLGIDCAAIVEWDAGVEMYPGGAIAGGPRMLFAAGSHEADAADVDVGPQGGYNLTAEGEKIFRNAIAYMLPAAEEPGPAPVGHWQFDEGSGTIAADSSGSGLDGTISGAEWVSPGSDGTGFCLDFDGLGTDRVFLGTFDVIGDGISIACWYKADNLDTPGNDPRLFSKAIGGASEEHWFMVSSSRVSGEKRLRFRLKTDGATGELKAGPDGTMELDAWTHVVASWDGETMRLHKNGVEVGSLAKGGTLSTDPTVKVSIGNQPEGAEDRPWDGLIDDVRVYNIGLSQAEIDEIISGQ